MKHSTISDPYDLEIFAELLRERIYATLALIAVLISINPNHSTPLVSAGIVTGTIVSLWAASIASTQMSDRIVFKDSVDHIVKLRVQINRHMPMLYSLIFPLVLIGLSATKLLSLNAALNIATVGSGLLLAIWSIDSVKTFSAKTSVLVIALIAQLAIIFGIVALKVALGH